MSKALRSVSTALFDFSITARRVGEPVPARNTSFTPLTLKSVKSLLRSSSLLFFVSGCIQVRWEEK
jgi:hypothetical protein